MSRNDTGATPEPEKLAAVRRFLLLILMVGSLGTGFELLFIGHVEDRLQFVPVVLLPAGLIVAGWHVSRPSPASARSVRFVMALFVAASMLGIGLHYQSNEEFELEMNPSAAGTELLKETLTGAIPVLAPGSMALLGLVGFAAVHGYSPGPYAGSSTKEEDAS